MNPDDELGSPLPMTWIDFAVVPVALVRGFGQMIAAAVGPLENSMLRASSYHSLRKVQRDSFRTDAGQAIERIARGEKNGD